MTQAGRTRVQSQRQHGKTGRFWGAVNGLTWLQQRWQLWGVRDAPEERQGPDRVAMGAVLHVPEFNPQSLLPPWEAAQ